MKINSFLQVRYSNGHIWNAHYHSLHEAYLFAKEYAKHWDLNGFKFTIKSLAVPNCHYQINERAKCN